MADLPTGTVTFLFTDVGGSTRLWEQHPAAMRAATGRHDALVEEKVEGNGGVVVRPRGEGDSRFAVFARASDAVAAAFTLQLALHTESWPTPVPVRVRMALHTGEADLRDGDYYGATVNRCARLRAIAHGGQTILSQTTHDLVRQALPDGVGLRDLGEHRLADLTLPERVFQVSHPALPADFAPLRSLDALPNNLPLQLTSFVGRESEIAEVGRLLASVRLLTLTGTGGCGKTRLALQVVGDLVATYPDGVWLVELAPLADPSLVPGAIAAAMGVREGPGQPVEAVLLSASRRKATLLVLDNCEHLLDACIRIADALLRACPGVRILATSREPLGIAGEVSWRVPSLRAIPVGEAASPGAPAVDEATQLFVERAGAMQPGFRLTEQTGPVVVQICRRLDGIPLAIELAATRVKALSVEQIAARLDQRFRLLTGGSRAALPRQQTLAALVGWSYDLLAGPERTLFNRLSVFAGGFTLEAAEAVCSGVLGAGYSVLGDQEGPSIAAIPSTQHLAPSTSGDVLDLLSALVDKSLVVADGGAGGVERYRLLETLRQYGRERLVGAGEAQSIHQRHAAYYLGLAVEAEPHLTEVRQLVYLAQLDPEVDNLRAALSWYLDEGDISAGARLVRALFWFCWYRGRWGEWRDWLDKVLAQPGALDGAAHAWTIALAAMDSLLQGDATAMRQRFEKALAIAGEVGDNHTIAWIRVLQAHEWQNPDALGFAREGLARYREQGDAWGVVEATATLGFVWYWRGDAEQARALATESLRLARRLGDRRQIGGALELLGEIATAENGAEARAYLTESLRFYRELGDVTGVASDEKHLGRLDVLSGHPGSAGEHYRASLRLTRDWRWMERIVQSLDGLAAVAGGLGQPVRALRLAGAANALGRSALQIAPQERREIDRLVESARQVLAEETAAAAWAEGEAMTEEQAIAYALREDSDA
jgi:predicted ATPase/class 3 adenylate cyclase